MLMIQSAPATALSRSGGTEYASDSTKQTAYAIGYGAASRNARICPTPMRAMLNAARWRGRHRRAAQVGDVALVPVEGAVERERAAVEADDPEHEAHERRAERTPAAAPASPTASR